MARQTRRDGKQQLSNSPNIRPFAPISGTRASELVVEQIREAFFTGMQSGDWLGTETDLAQRFGVSRLTMRDAVRTLEAYGMVDVKVGAGGGLRIAKTDSKHFAEALAVQIHLLGVGPEEIAEALEIIEPHAARLAARRRSADQLEQLSEALARHKNPNGDPRGFHDAAAEFHVLIAEASGNQPVSVALSAIRINEAHRLEPRALPAQAAIILREHRKVFAAIEAQDADAALAAMTEHVTRIAGNLSVGPEILRDKSG